MPSRRSLLSCALAPAILAGGLPARSLAQGGSAKFVGIDEWLNTDRPPTIAGLRGKVVLVEFGTYTCIYWRRTLPYVSRWDREYGSRGLRTICVHTPEFTFEHTRANVERVTRELGVTYPIALDNSYRTWRAFDNEAWPSFYLMDQDGQVRLVREGEGHSQEIEGAVRSLLGLPREKVEPEDADLSQVDTPEFYFGALHPTPQDRAQSPRRGEATYAFAQLGAPKLSEYQLDGRWARGEEGLVLLSPRGSVRVSFSAAKLYLVATATLPVSVHVSVDGRVEPNVKIAQPTLYTLVDGDRYGEHLLELECTTPGLSIVSATFG